MTIKRESVYWGSKHPKDYLLAHNPVRPVEMDQAHGIRGFRVMWIPPEYLTSHGFKVCDCGWRPEKGNHYSVERPQPAPVEAA